ncbi:MAG: non-homologous end-joining DNA ligase [Candidatus Korobacteraceae bacterium]
MTKETAVDVEGKHLKLSNLDKVLYPEAGFTKGQVIDYYVRIAPALLPHLRGRPLTMKRYPNGVSGSYFYEKNCPEHRPEWVQTARVWSSGNNRWMNYCLAEDLPTLVWAANLADLELHTSLSLGKDILRPTFLVFDLDPGPPANIVQCCQVGLWVRDILAQLQLQSFAKTSGSKGLQIYVPLNTAVTYDQTKPFAHELARVLERQHPNLVVSDMKKALRTGKVLVDWSQNDDHKTTVCVYSLRAKERPMVSTPVKWDEVESCLKKGDASLLVFESDEVLARAKKHGDLFEPVLKLKQRMPPVEALQKLKAGASAKPEAALKRAAAPSEPKKKATTPRAKSKAGAAKKAPPRRKRV